MNRSLERSLVERWSGLRIIKVSLTIGLAGTLPLLLYIAIGPSDGNPIGLGLLAVVAVPITVIGTLAGLVKSLAQIARR